MDEYQKSIVARLFEPYPGLSQSSCHQFVLDHVAPILFPITANKVDVQPSPFQRSLSYTAILSSSHDQRIVVQFRLEQQDLFGAVKANRIHSSLVPLVAHRGTYGSLFVYTAPFVEGTPYIQLLMSSPDFELPLYKAKATVLDIADVVTHGARANGATLDVSSILDGIRSIAADFPFDNANLQSHISTCIDKIIPQVQNLTTLPVALTHPNLTPFNYLVDGSTGRVRAVLDWDGALYLPIGTNFHFLESFFGYMTPQGWKASGDGQELSTAFHARVSSNLAAQGFEGITKERLELPNAIGMMDYYVERILRLKDKRNKQCLDAYLQQLTFMDGVTPSC